MAQSVRLDPQTLLSAYSQGVFPMADRDRVIRFYTADPRGVVPLDERFHVPQTLGQLMRKDPPVDLEYLAATHVLERAEAAGVLVANRPRALTSAQNASLPSIESSARAAPGSRPRKSSSRAKSASTCPPVRRRASCSRTPPQTRASSQRTC